MSRKFQIPELTNEQIKAADLLLAGMSVTDTAGEIGVTRETVSRWRNKNSAFIAYTNQARLELYAANQDEMNRLVGRALDTLGVLLDSENDVVRLKAALGLLKSVEIEARPLNLETDPATVEANLFRQEKEVQFQLLKRDKLK